MKVLHICSYYLGANIYRDMCRNLVNKGVDISAFVPEEKNKDKGIAVDDFVQISKCFRKYDRFIFRYKQAKILKSIKKSYKFESFDMIHAHTLFSNGNIAYRLNKQYGIPYVVAVRSTDLYFFFKKLFWLNGLGNKILKNAKAIIFIAPPSKELLLNCYVKPKNKEEIAAKCHIIPNGLERFWCDNRHANQMTVNNKTVNILTVGQIYWKKNMLICSEACKLLSERGYQVHHTIVGSKDDRTMTKKLVDMGFSQLVDPVPKEELMRYYRENHIFLLPSVVETFGRVYAEALTQGVPVVYSKGQGFDGFFEDGEVGFAVDPRSIVDIADKLEDIVTRYEYFKANCNAVKNMFDWDELTDRYIAIYTDKQGMV